MFEHRLFPNQPPVPPISGKFEETLVNLTRSKPVPRSLRSDVRLLDDVRQRADYPAISLDYPVILKKSDEGYAVGCPALPGCWSQGATEEEEALQNIRIAIQEYLQVMQEGLKGEDSRSVTVTA